MSQAKGNIESIAGLTSMQAGLLFHTLHAPESPLYFEQFACTLEGELDVAAWKQAWDHIVHRHPSLRTLFTWEKRNEPLQVVRERVEVPWHEEDLQASSDAEVTLSAYLKRDRERGFDLEKAPLLRLAMFQTDASRFRFIWSFHHLILDGWSMLIVLDECFRTYASLRTGNAPALSPARPYRDYVAWLAEQDLGPAETHWRKQLRGFETRTPLPLQRSGDHGTWASRHETTSHSLPKDLTTRLEGTARDLRVTLNTLVRAAWGLVLARHAGENDVVFGATVSGRPEDLKGAENMVGLFIQTLPVRIQLDVPSSTRSWLTQLQEDQLASATHESTPLVQVQKWSELSGPLFQSILVFQNLGESSGDAALRDAGLTSSDRLFVRQSNYPLAILVFPGEQLEFQFVYDADRYDETSIPQLGSHLENALQSISEDPERAPSELRILSPEETKLLLDYSKGIDFLPARLEGSSCDAERKQTALTSTLTATAGTRLTSASAESTPSTVDSDFVAAHHRIAEHARTIPDAIAIQFENQSCSYGEMGNRVEQLSAELQQVGAKKGTLVAISLERSIEMIVGILAILETGAAYVPIDPKQPEKRIEFVLAETKSVALVTVTSLLEKFATLPLPTIAESAPTTASERADALRKTSETVPSDASEDLAYVLYTSGSTGRPKGVEITHKNLAHSTDARLQYYGETAPRYLLVSPFVFDSSVAGIFWTLRAGGTLVLPAPQMEQDLVALAKLIESAQVTHILALPALYGLLLEHAKAAQLPSLEVVIFAGEAAAPAIARAHFSTLPKASLFNEYGPTEATVWSTVHQIEPADLGGPIPIGRPLPGTRAIVLDAEQQLAPLGAAGELYLGGPGLARGYHQDIDLTQSRFIEIYVPHPGASETGETLRLYRTGDRARIRPDGALDFLGRIDDQVKLHGHRIELGEIEAVLKEHPLVSDAVALVQNGASPKRESAQPEDRTDAMRVLQTLGPAAAEELISEVEAMGEIEVETFLSHLDSPEVEDS